MRKGVINWDGRFTTTPSIKFSICKSNLSVAILHCNNYYSNALVIAL
jgi:hypothetical protein